MTGRAFKIGLWGCGGRTHALIERAVAEKRATVTCCYDIDGERSAAVAAAFGAQSVASADELIGFDDVDAFLICLFPGLHAQALIKALPSGKPIYAEKPVATTWEDYHALRETAKRHSQWVHVGLIHRYYPIFSTVEDVVKSGKIGDVLSLTINWLTDLQPVESFPGGRENWHFREDTGGELIQHFCHSFDWLRALGGDFTHVTAQCNHLRENDIPIEDTWDILLRHDSGVLVNFHSSMNNPRGTEMGWIEGTNGSLEWEWNKPSTLKYFAKTGEKQQRGETIPMNDTPPDATTRVFGLFLDSLESGTPKGPSLNDGLWASLVPLMAKRSAEEGKTLELPHGDLLKNGS